MHTFFYKDISLALLKLFKNLNILDILVNLKIINKNNRSRTI